MSVNVDKMKKAAADSKRGGEFLSFEIGDTKAYIHGPCRDDDEFELTAGTNFVPVTVHYQVGKQGNMVICTDPDKNPIINHPFVRALLKKRKNAPRLDGTCAVCEEIESGGMESDAADDSRPQTKFIWGATKIQFRRDKGDDWRDEPFKPGVLMAGKSIHDGFLDLFVEGGDITKTDGATLARIEREGKGKNDTKYKVTADSATIKVPLRLDKKVRLALEKAMAEGGDCDLFKVVANMIKSTSEVKALLSGVKVDVDSTDDDEDDVEDDEPKKKSKKSDDDDDNDDDEDEDDDEPKKKSKKSDDDDDNDDDEDEDDDEPKKKSKKSDDDDDGNDDDDEDDDDDGDDEPKKKSKKSDDDDEDEPKKKSKKSDDDLGLDELGAELDRLSKKKKGKA
jgi:hypothetical protein